MTSSRKYSSGYKGLKIPLCLILLALVASCSPRPPSEYIKGDALGTFFTLSYWSKEDSRIHNLDTDIDKLLNDFEDELSNWREDSWISRFNAAPAGEFIPAPDHAFQVLALCMELAERSGGALDPTLSPLIELWGFGTREHTRPPSQTEIEAALEKTGYQKLELDYEKKTALKTRKSVRLNCSAVAKGYAVDLVAQLLEAKGIQNFLINIGGEISARGSSPEGDPWLVGINQPQPDGRIGRPKRTISLLNRSLATSGHSQRAYVINGQRYSHILNAKTGMPAPTHIASATVLAPNCALADGLATLALILDDGRLNKLLQHYENVEVFRTPWENF